VRSQIFSTSKTGKKEKRRERREVQKSKRSQICSTNKIMKTSKISISNIPVELANLGKL
jgi:hypothetical protein